MAEITYALKSSGVYGLTNGLYVDSLSAGTIGDGLLATTVDRWDDGSAGTPSNSNWSYSNAGSLDESSPLVGSGSLQLDGGGSSIVMTRSADIQPSSIRFFVRNDETQSSESNQLDIFFENTAGTDMVASWAFASSGAISPDAGSNIFSGVEWRDGEVIQCDTDNITYTGSGDTYDATVKNLSTGNSDTITGLSKVNNVDFGGLEITDNPSWRVDDFSHS